MVLGGWVGNCGGMQGPSFHSEHVRDDVEVVHSTQVLMWMNPRWMQAAVVEQRVQREEAPVGARPVITPVAASLHRTINDLEAWHRRKESRIALAQRHAAQQQQSEAATDLTFHPQINSRSRRIAATSTPRQRPWSSPPRAVELAAASAARARSVSPSACTPGSRVSTTALGVRAAGAGTGSYAASYATACKYAELAAELLRSGDEVRQSCASVGEEAPVLPSEQKSELDLLLAKLEGMQEDMAGLKVSDTDRATYVAKYLQARQCLDAAKAAASMAAEQPASPRTPKAARSAGGSVMQSYASLSLAGSAARTPQGSGAGAGPVGVSNGGSCAGGVVSAAGAPGPVATTFSIPAILQASGAAGAAGTTSGPATLDQATVAAAAAAALVVPPTQSAMAVFASQHYAQEAVQRISSLVRDLESVKRR